MVLYASKEADAWVREKQIRGRGVPGITCPFELGLPEFAAPPRCCSKLLLTVPPISYYGSQGQSTVRSPSDTDMTIPLTPPF